MIDRKMAGWTWISACCRGTAHARLDERRQDAYRCSSNQVDAERLVVAVSDGAGSAVKGGPGAAVTVRAITLRASAHLRTLKRSPTDEEIWDWLDEARERIYLAASKRDLAPRDFAATLICVISTGNETLTFHVGDGAAVAKCAETGKWFSLSWPENGEYASTTFFVTDEPSPRLRISRCDRAISSFAVLTDGLERLALDFAQEQPYTPFFSSIFRPLESSGVVGEDFQLSRQLAAFLDSEPVNSRTDDDKTLILATKNDAS